MQPQNISKSRSKTAQVLLSITGKILITLGVLSTLSGSTYVWFENLLAQLPRPIYGVVHNLVGFVPVLLAIGGTLIVLEIRMKRRMNTGNLNKDKESFWLLIPGLLVFIYSAYYVIMSMTGLLIDDEGGWVALGYMPIALISGIITLVGIHYFRSRQ